MGLGNVVRLLVVGIAATLNVCGLEGVPPAPFCTKKLKTPLLKMVAGPVMLVEDLLVMTLLGITHEVVVGQLGPVTYTCAVDGSRFVPVIVKLNWLPNVIGLGKVVIPLVVGAPIGRPNV